MGTQENARRGEWLRGSGHPPDGLAHALYRKMPVARKIPLRANAAHAMKSLMIKSMNIGNWWWAR
jgi:hypothetical protein